MSSMVIEHNAAGVWRIVRESGTITGPTLEDVLVTAMVKAGVGSEDQIHGLSGSFMWAGALETLMEHGKPARLAQVPGQMDVDEVLAEIEAQA